ncbi:hypothetical protein VAB18032_21650 [Micromonospora maris AB-18-032]|nr:hypothetical protein VAB18032_21650 [Micromonospora maris AB-18-032]
MFRADRPGQLQKDEAPATGRACEVGRQPTRTDLGFAL